MSRAGLFFAGLFGGVSWGATTSATDARAFNESNVARPAQDISLFKETGWYKGRQKPFSSMYKNYLLGDVIQLTHDVALFRFLLPNEDDEFHLKPCSTLQARVQYGGSSMDTIQRFYTPVTPNGACGYFDIIVKRKASGRMTSHLFGMRVGDSMQFRNTMFKLQYKPNRWDEVGMIAGGTGFTPMLQVIRHALRPVDDPFETKVRSEVQRAAAAAAASAAAAAANPKPGAPLGVVIENIQSADALSEQQQQQQPTPADDDATTSIAAASAASPSPPAPAKRAKAAEPDRTRLSFLYCNRTENHILLKSVFEKLAEDYPDRFRVTFCVDKAVRPGEWKGYTGYVTHDMVRATMPAPTAKRSIVLLCGPDHLLHHVAGTSYYALDELSKGRATQPSGGDLANLTTVGGVLGDLGYTSDNVYKF